MKYLITYNYDDWGDFTDEAIETCDTVEEVENIIYNIKNGAFIGENQRNIKVYKAEEVTDEFDTKTRFDDDYAR